MENSPKFKNQAQGMELPFSFDDDEKPSKGQKVLEPFTGEKVALALHFDGRFAAIFGTHTHVPTADLTILPAGTAYVTDLGMCGARGGVLGIDKSVVIKRYLTALPIHFTPAEGELYADAVIFTADEATGKAVSLERVTLSL